MGLAAGLLKSIFDGVRKLTKNNFIAGFVMDIVWCFVAGLVFILTIFTLNNGEFAFFELVAFGFGIVFEMIFVKNIFASFIIKVYNKLRRKRRKKDDANKTSIVS